MKIDGEWRPCDDGVLRPVIRGEALAADGSWVHTLFLVDTGADRTVLDAVPFVALGHRLGPIGERLAGVGGMAEAGLIETELRLCDEEGRRILFRGEYAAITQAGALDTCILGRDITDRFAVVIDRAGDRVCLVRRPHRCRIERS